MAELEKVIKAIECCIDEKHGCYNCEFKYTDGKVACRMFEESYNSIPTELIKNALELMKKQTPIEPEYFMDGLVKRCRCKKCGKHIVSVGKYRDNYCAKCGQAVKWE